MFFLYISSSSIWGQDSDVSTFLRDHLMVYYVEDPSSDQYRLINPNEITSGQLLFGGNPELEIAQNLVRDIFIPGSDSDFQQRIKQALVSNVHPSALFIYFDRGPVDISIASANWTNCIENGHFTACVTKETDDDYTSIVHFGANLMNSDGIVLAKNRLLSLLGPTSGNSTNDLESALQDGVTLTFYTSYINSGSSFTQKAHNTFREAAIDFARKHNSISLEGSELIIGENAAMPVLTVAEIIDKSEEILEKLKRVRNNPTLKVSTIAIMTHGLNKYINFGNRNIIAINEDISRQRNGGNAPDAYETAETFANALDPIIKSQGKLIFYACLAGSTITDAQWKTNPMTNSIRTLIREDYLNGGVGCIAKKIKDHLNTANGQREVWAHRTKGHSTANPIWRVFKGSNVSGQPYEGLPFITASSFLTFKGMEHLLPMVNGRLESLNSTSAIDNDQLNKWMAKEVPFLPSTLWPLVNVEPQSRNASDFHFKDGLVEWFANRWISQNLNTP